MNKNELKLRLADARAHAELWSERVEEYEQQLKGCSSPKDLSFHEGRHGEQRWYIKDEGVVSPYFVDKDVADVGDYNSYEGRAQAMIAMRRQRIYARLLQMQWLLYGCEWTPKPEECMWTIRHSRGDAERFYTAEITGLDMTSVPFKTSEDAEKVLKQLKKEELI